MQPQLKDILHYYIGHKHRYKWVDSDQWQSWCTLTLSNITRLDDFSIEGIQLALRPLDSMTEEEIVELIDSMIPGRNSHYVVYPFYKQADRTEKDLAIGAEYYNYDTGVSNTITILQNGLVTLWGEGISCAEPLIGGSIQFHYLLSRGFDLFGGIDAGWAVDVKTIN